MTTPLSDWKLTTIGALGRVLTGRTPSSAKPELFGSDYPFITPTDIQEGQHFVRTERFLSEEGLQSQSSLLLPSKAICFVCIGSIGKICITDRPSFTNQQINSIIVYHDKHDHRFVYHLLRFQADRIKAQAGGVATPIVNKTAFSNVEVLVPALPVQQRIGGILAAYDDLIENNTRRIKILEEMARMIYREWFVNFRFPGHEKVKMVESETGIIPEGWEMRTLPNLCSKVIDGTHDSPLRVSQGYPLVTGKHFTDGFIHFDECYFISPEEHEKVMQRSKPEKGDILFSNIGTLGSIAMVPDQPKFSIKNVALFKPRKAIYSGFLYLHFVLPETLTELQAKASGTSQRFFSLEFLRGLKLVTPPDEILDRFDCCTKPILEERLLLNEAIRNLRHTRDLLLPKLISGEINVENFETETVAQGV